MHVSLLVLSNQQSKTQIQFRISIKKGKAAHSQDEDLNCFGSDAQEVETLGLKRDIKEENVSTFNFYTVCIAVTDHQTGRQSRDINLHFTKLANRL